MTEHDPIVIVGMARTAIAGFQGAFAPLTASELGSAAIRAALQRAGVSPEDVSELPRAVSGPDADDAAAEHVCRHVRSKSMRRDCRADSDGAARTQADAVHRIYQPADDFQKLAA